MATCDQEDLQTLCHDFELANLKIPVISAYEARKTKLFDRRSIVNILKRRSRIVGLNIVAVEGPDEYIIFEKADFSPGRWARSMLHKRSKRNAHRS